MNSENTGSGSAEMKIGGPRNVDSAKFNYDEQDLHEAGNIDIHTAAVQDSNQPPRKRKKVATKPRGRKYLLRSSGDGARVLRAKSNEKCKTQSEPVITPVNQVTKRGKKRRKMKTTSTDEYSRARKRIRYLLNRMNYEQSLIDAYAGEGWKGQSAEKIRPEKELERAKSEILRCKLKIRDLFCHLDSLSSEGRFEEALFDSEGQISSDDIFCAKCRSSDSSIDNDIILCDGVCDRGFHQKCLNPPLLSADIPDGDEGWLCPACDCKVDCIDLLNESQGSDVSIEDTWEKIFPEAAAIENGDKRGDDFPSDDSEDYEYDPDRPEVDVDDHSNETDHEEQSDSKESEFSTAGDSDASERPKQSEDFGLPSDDSEDDDFDPDAPDLDKDIQKDGSNSDESDFTSDSDDFCKEISKTSAANEDSASSLLKNGGCPQETNYSSLNSEIPSTLEGDLNIDNILVGKRHIERLDYKKKYDETYGKLSSESSEDEDWLESPDVSMPKKSKKDGIKGRKAKAGNVKNKISSRSDTGKLLETEAADKLDSNTVKEGEQHHAFKETDSNVNKSPTSVSRRLGSIPSQRLFECFQENQYPNREKKESLAQELGLTVRQVNKWFDNARHSYRVSMKESSEAGGASSQNEMEGRVGKSGTRTEHDDKLSEGESLLTEKLDGVTGQNSSSRKGKNSVPARKSVVGAENGSIPDDNDDTPGPSPIKKGKGKNSTPASRSKARAEHVNGNEDVMEADKDRQKAIARELKRMKQRR